MERKMKKLDNGEKSPISNPNPNLANWTSIPEHLLLLIIDRLSSIVDLLSAASVCHSWRSAAASASSSAAPLVFLPVLSPHCRQLTWSSPTRCNLETLTLTPKSFPCNLPPQTLCLTCIGFSHSHSLPPHPPLPFVPQPPPCHSRRRLHRPRNRLSRHSLFPFLHLIVGIRHRSSILAVLFSSCTYLLLLFHGFLNLLLKTGKW